MFLRFLAGFFLCATAAIACAQRPNLIVYLSDDLGRLETSLHGSPDVKTPTLDRLADAGMVFENAYVASPSCCPNRYSLLTGLMPARHGAHPNHSKPKPGTTYLLPRLKALGYHIASFGKVAHGRDRMKGVDHFSPRPRDLFHQVQTYFEQHSPDGPVCLLIGDRRPHVAWTKEMDYSPDSITLPKHLVDTPETRAHWCRYLTDITGMDREMGQVRDFLTQELGDNTIFLFTSDHGGQWPLGKWNLYDSGTRIPLVVSWPGNIPAGRRTDAMVSWVDLLPTIIDLAGGEVPDTIDGRSFAPVLLEGRPTHRDAIFTTHTGDGAMNVFPIRSVRIGQFKYIHNLRADGYHTNHSDRLRKDGAGAYWDSWDAVAKNDAIAAEKIRRYYTRPAEEFFDLSNDPSESRNLIDDPNQSRRIKAMKETLAQWMNRQGDDAMPHRAIYPITESLPDLR